MSNINNNNENDITCKKNSYLIIFDDNACNLLKKHILTFLKNNGYESNENKSDNFYTLKITKKSQPNWIDYLFHNFQNEKENNNNNDSDSDNEYSDESESYSDEQEYNEKMLINNLILINTNSCNYE